MKIVQTLWTLPSLDKNSRTNLENRLSGGWLYPKYYYCAMAYSCLTLKKFYENIELVSDEFGADLLINKLKLPYTSVKILPDYFNSIPVGLWALPKIYSYSIQSEPFIHVDNDIFIWDELHKNDVGLLVQNFENLSDGYDVGIQQIVDNCETYPDFLLGLDKYEFQSINAGVFGGNDVNFIQKYTQFVFDFVNANLKNISHKDSGIINAIFEQLFFYQLAKAENKRITTVLPQEKFDNMANLVKFEQISFGCKYIHCLGKFKKNKNLCKQVEFRLYNDYPETYQKIIKLLKSKDMLKGSSAFDNYERASALFSCCKTQDDLLNIPLMLSPNIEIEKHRGRYFLVEDNKKYLLKNWNKILLFFYGQFRTVSDLLEDFAKSELGNVFTYEDTKDNVISLICFHSMYYNRFVKLQM